MNQSEIIFEVVKVKWKRIFLTLDVKTNYKGNVSFTLENMGRVRKDERNPNILVSVKIKESIPVAYESSEDGIYHFYWNITAMHKDQFLDNGRWRMIANTPDGQYICFASHEVGYQFDDYSRIFRYGGGKYAYNVSFSAETDKEKDFWFVLNTYFVMRNNHWKKRRYIQEALTIPGKFKRTYMFAVIRLIRGFYKFWSHALPKNGKNLMLMSETKDYLWGNLKAIDDNLHARGLDKEFHISYSFRRAVGSHKSMFSWIKTIFKIARQDYIFVDDYVPVFGFLNLEKRTKLIQVWHAGVGFKSVGYSRFGKTGTPFPSESCHKKYDYVLVGSEKLVEVYSEVFGLGKEHFLPVGMPRLDGFLDEDHIGQFRKGFYKEYPQLEGKKLILFAPTFRGTGQKSAYYKYDLLDLKRIHDFCADEYVFLIKMHPFVKDPIKIPQEYQDSIVDFSDYPNINDLYYVTDILITDYSSNYFEYSLMKRPIMFFTPDREFYEISRGVHRSVKEAAPGKVCDTFDELMTALEQKDYEIEKVYQFVEDNFSNYDGHATDRAIDQILFGKEI